MSHPLSHSRHARPDRRVGPYQVLAPLGEGGMGVVHLAAGPDGRRVALKVLRPHVVGDQEGRERLAREVASLRKVRSRHVAEVLDADPWGELAFIVTRYVPGDSLTEQVRRDGPLRGADLEHLADVLLAAVVDVHASGVVHRDVKPTNVVMEGRSPVLIDFGLARLAEDPAMTATGILLGTPGYLAPELLLGEQPTGAVDVHGWAATVAFAGQGTSPYGRGHTMAILDRTRRGEADLSGVPAALRPLLAAALSPEPLERPTTREVAAELDRLRGDDRPTTALAVAPPLSEEVRSGEDEPLTPMTPMTPMTQPWATRGDTVDDTGDATGDDTATAQVDAVGPTPATRVADAAGAAPTVRPTLVGPAAPPSIAPVPADPRLAEPPGHVARDWPPPPSPTSVQPVPVMAPVPGGPLSTGPWQRPLSGWARARRATMLLLLVVLVAVAARLTPYATAFVVGVVAVLARAATRSRDALWRRRSTRGAAWWDRPRSVVGFPWHLLATATGSLVLACAAALSVSGTVMAALFLGATSAQALTAGGVVLAWTVWWGPGATRVRRSVLPVLTTLARPATHGLVAIGVLVAVTAVLWILHTEGGTVWLPAGDAPWAGLRARLDGWIPIAG